MIKKIYSIKFLLLLFSLFIVAQRSVANNALFNTANQLYANGKYAEAAQKYQAIEQSGYYSYELYYNLGNCFYRSNQIGLSILYYEKAKKLNPTDPDLLNNLRMAYLKTIDKIEPEQILFFEKIGLNILYLFSPNQWAYLTLIFLFITALLLVLQKKLSSFKQLLLISAVLFFFLFLSSFFLSWKIKQNQENQSYAIVLNTSVNSYSEPNQNSSLLFTLHEGTRVLIKEEQGDWCRVELPNSITGWVSRSSVRSI
jgi:tetratricopeptide (TPR) repeat protein